MGLFSKLRGGGKSSKSQAEAVSYNGYQITPSPQKTSGGYRVGAVITREKDGEVQTHNLVRSDVISSQEEAIKVSENKAKMAIDQLGDDLF